MGALWHPSWSPLCTNDLLSIGVVEEGQSSCDREDPVWGLGPVTGRVTGQRPRRVGETLTPQKLAEWRCTGRFAARVSEACPGAEVRRAFDVRL